MSWREREYNHGGHGGGGALNGVMAVLNGCVPLGRWFGIRVRVHAAARVWALHRGEDGLGSAGGDRSELGGGALFFWKERREEE
jgi:hypothetical protein